MRGHAQYLQEMLLEAASGAPTGTSQLLLKSAIAFIDSFDTGLDLDTLNPNRSIQTQDDLLRPPRHDGKRSNVNGVKRKRETNYSTRAQQGRKAEIQALPTIEYQELQRSEEINCKLKAIVSQQQKLAQRYADLGLKAFDQVRFQAIINSDQFFAAGKRVTNNESYRPRADAKYNTATITKLEDEVTRLYRSLDCSFL
ncbi:hypothetical protein GQ600_18399 [Phytophthora cactorum]|nr:hypothetical protein GQ600_18399 [Phytophthora cactorum]